MSRIKRALDAFLSVCKDEGVDPTIETARRLQAGRRVQPRKHNQHSLMDNVLAAMLDKKLAEHTKELVSKHRTNMDETGKLHAKELKAAEEAGQKHGYQCGRSESKAEQGPHFEKLVADRLCDEDKNLPWPVGVIVVGEQHRILQALADYCERGGLDFPVERFYKEALALPHVPLRTDGPEPIRIDNCDTPPVPDDDTYKWCFPNMDDFWRYYLWQSTADDESVARLEIELP